MQGRAVTQARGSAPRNPCSTSEIDSDSTYDADGRLDHTYQPFYNGSQAYLHHQQVYDELNRVIQTIEPDEVGNPLTTLTAYQGMATQVTNPKAQTMVSYRDALGQVAQMQDALGNLTTYTRDAWGNLASVTDSNSNVTQILYDALGHKTDLIDPDLGHIVYCVDARGLTWQQISPIAASGSSGLSSSNACTQAWPKADNMSFDVLDRMVSRIEPNLNSYWTYDSTTSVSTCAANSNSKTCGKLVEACTGSGGTAGSNCSTITKDYDRTQSYDSLSRPSATSTTLYAVNGLAGAFTSIANYDNWGRPCSIFRQAGSTASGVTYVNAYSATGYLAQIVRVGTGSNIACTDYSNYTSTTPAILWQADEQDAANRVTANSLGNGLTVSRSYDPFTGHLSDSAVVAGGGSSSSNIVSEGYQYDVLGNVTNRTEAWGNNTGNSFSESFGYDNLNRLHSSQTLIQTNPQLYNFDNLGNITNKSGVGSGTAGPGQYSYTYSQSACANVTGAAPSGPHAVTSIGGITSGNNGAFCYDADGNLLADPWRTTSWTDFDMPATITEGSNSSTFTYGPEHQRTRQIRSDITLLYADGMEIDTPTSGSGTNTIKTYWPAGLGLETSTGGTPTYTWTHGDNLDSVVAITDVNGNLVQSMAYDAWGARRDLQGDAGVVSAASGYLNGQALIDNKGFTRQEELDQLGLVHLNGRVYDPFTGRFMSGDPDVQDPYHSQSYNRYTYVWNNPTNLTDPTGFDPNGQNSPPPSPPPTPTPTPPKTVDDWKNYTIDQKIEALNAWVSRTGDGLGNPAGLANNAKTTTAGPAANSGSAGGGCLGHAGACHLHSITQGDDPIPTEGVESVCPECWLIGMGEVRGTVVVAEKVIPKIIVTSTKPIAEGEVVTFGEFAKRSVVGDNLEGHELWQHANLKANNLAKNRLGSAASKDNPVIALSKETHVTVNAAQRALDAAAQTPAENIAANAKILRELKVAPESTITKFENWAMEHAKSLGF